MIASIVPLPTAAREPVKQHKRRGRYPKGVVSIRGHKSPPQEAKPQAEYEMSVAVAHWGMKIVRDPLLLQKFLPAWERLNQKQRDTLVEVTCGYAELNGEQS